MKVEELVSSIRRNEIVIPEFQREFVWNKSRSKELINSLLNEYPVGGILIWKTENPPHLKGDQLDFESENYRSYQSFVRRSATRYIPLHAYYRRGPSIL